MSGPLGKDTAEIRFDDLDTLRTVVVDGFGVWSEPLMVPQSTINSFAELAGDYQWIHVDEERCRTETPFGRTIAHGALVVALLPRLSPHAVTVVGHHRAVNYGSNRVRFLAPVLVDSSISARSRLKSVVQKPSGSLLTTEVQVRANEKKDAICLIYEMMVLYQGNSADM